MHASRRASIANGGLPPRSVLRSALALGAALLLLCVAVAGLWYQDWRYSLPTPRPANLAQPAPGQRVFADDLGAAALVADGRPLWLHFTSSECPCSRFAADHVRALVRDCGARVRFVAVEEGEGGSGVELGMPEIADPDGRIARRFGVYSTPQAVLLAGDGSLWYRGNYNASRYCSDARSAYARLALEALLGGAPRPEFPAPATVAYGCALPHAEGAP